MGWGCFHKHCMVRDDCFSLFSHTNRHWCRVATAQWIALNLHLQIISSLPILLSAGIPSRVNMKYQHRKGVWQQVRHAFLPLWTSAFQSNIRCTTHTHRNTQKQLVRPTRSASLVRGHTPFRYPQHPVPRWAKLWQILRSIFCTEPDRWGLCCAPQMFALA